MRDPRDDRGVFHCTAAGLCIGLGAWSLGRNLRDVRLSVVVAYGACHASVKERKCVGFICSKIGGR